MIRQYLPLLEEEGRDAATGDDTGRDRHYLPELPDEDPYQAGHRTCAGCGPAIEYRWVLKAVSQDTVVAGPTGCMYVANSTYLCTPYTVPWAHTPIASGGSFTVRRGGRVRGADPEGRHPGPYPNIIVMVERRAARPTSGSGSISGALYRNHDALFICYDNECYANTGIQVSPTTPYAGMTTFTPFGKAMPEGTSLPPKNLAKMMAAGHPHCYVATTTVGYPVDLMNKTRKGLNHRGAAFMHCFTPCQKGWVYQTSMTVEIGRRVVEAGLVPGLGVRPGRARVPATSTRRCSGRSPTTWLCRAGSGTCCPSTSRPVQAQANRNWELIGMDVPQALRDLEDPARHQRLADERVLDAHQPRHRRLSDGGRCCSTAALPAAVLCRTGRPCSGTCSCRRARTRPARGSRCTPRPSESGSPIGSDGGRRFALRGGDRPGPAGRDRAVAPRAA